MTHAIKMSAFVAMGLLMTATTLAAQQAPATTSGGQITFGALAAGNSGQGSSKFTEYREFPKGPSIPFISFYSTSDKLDLMLTGYNVQQSNQRFLGQVKGSGMGLKFDWNEIPHNMGNDGRTIFNNTSPTDWTVSQTIRTALENALNATVPTTARNYTWYSTTLAPVLASTSLMDISAERKTGKVDLNLGSHLPVDVTLSYRNESKTGYRGVAGLNIRGIAGTMTEFANPMDEVTHDIGIRATKKFKLGNVYATFNRNSYNNRAEKVTVDYLFQGVDALITPAAGAIPSKGGLSKDHFINAPDNEASLATAGFLLKFKMQTRISGGIALSTMTQDAAYYPYTASTVVTPSSTGVGLQPLPQLSYGGKINTTMYNLSFSTRPFDGLSLRAQYRMNELKDKSNKFIITGDMSGSNGQWNVITPSADVPFGHATANRYDTKSSRLTASAAYDFRALTVEGQYRHGTLERTSREAEKGTEKGAGVTALFHANDWLGFRGTYDQGKRTAEGHTILGYTFDEAAFTNTRTGLDVELSPMAGLDVSFAYFRRNVEYTDRPDRIALTGGVPVVGAVAIPNTPSGLLDAKYDSYTAEFTYAPSARIELGGYYTYEKDANTTQNSATASATAVAPLIPLGLNNLLTYASSDKTNTYGANGTYHLVPDKHRVMVNAMSQKVDGLQDITAFANGSFYTPGRTGLIPAGQGNAADITDFDDTELTTVSVQYDWTVNKGWTLTAGYRYEKYDFADAFNSVTDLMPLSPYIFMKPNFGAYDANIFFARVNHRF